MRYTDQTAQALRTVIQSSTLMQLAGAPSGSYLDEDGMPHLWVDGKDICQVRYSSFGEVFHDADSRCSGARYPSHLLDLVPCAPCRVCKPPVPNLQWYNRLLRITLVLSDNGVPLPYIALTPEDHLTADLIPPILPDTERYEEPSAWDANRAMHILQQAIHIQNAAQTDK